MIPSPKPNSPKATAREQALMAIRTKLLCAGLRFQECTPYHFKYGALNYYPTSGKIHRDGNHEPYRAKGIDAFLRACFKESDGIVGDPSDDEFDLLS